MRQGFLGPQLRDVYLIQGPQKPLSWLPQTAAFLDLGARRGCFLRGRSPVSVLSRSELGCSGPRPSRGLKTGCPGTRATGPCSARPARLASPLRICSPKWATAPSGLSCRLREAMSQARACSELQKKAVSGGGRSAKSCSQPCQHGQSVTRSFLPLGEHCFLPLKCFIR